jgi:hypothetical protein
LKKFLLNSFFAALLATATVLVPSKAAADDGQKPLILTRQVADGVVERIEVTEQRAYGNSMCVVHGQVTLIYQHTLSKPKMAVLDNGGRVVLTWDDGNVQEVSGIWNAKTRNGDSLRVTIMPEGGIIRLIPDNDPSLKVEKK